jgi:hypothetical protein
MLPSDLSPKESYQMSALAERVVADDSAVSENDKSGLARWELFTYCATASFFFCLKALSLRVINEVCVWTVGGMILA